MRPADDSARYVLRVRDAHRVRLDLDIASDGVWRPASGVDLVGPSLADARRMIGIAETLVIGRASAGRLVSTLFRMHTQGNNP